MRLHIFWDSLSTYGFQIPVSRMISALIGIPVTVSENPVRMRGYDTGRRQIDAAALLDSIQGYKRRCGIDDPVLLVINQDLFIQGQSSVFGLAREVVGAGVVSAARLNNEFYGKFGSEDDLTDRLVKEGTHEIGHMLGLPHCKDRECIMFKPDTLDELDRKKKGFCPTCRERLDSQLAVIL